MEKKDGKNYEVLKFLETLILIVLIGSAIIIVFEVFSDQMNGEEEEYDDYTYQDYSYDYYDDSYDEYDNYYSDLNNDTENTSVSNFSSIEDFMNSEEGKEFLEKSNQNLVNSNEVEVQNIAQDTTDKFTPGVEDIYNYYDESKSMEERFEEQKKKIEIKDEGKSLNDEIMVSIKNNNEDFLYDFSFNTIFYKGNKIVYIDTQDINIIDANNTKYIKVTEIPEEYDNYKFLISKRYYREYYNDFLNDDISFSSERTKDGIKIEVQNKSSQSINRIYFTILYFDNDGKLVDFEEVHKYSVNSNKTPTLYGYGILDDKNSRRFDFADYEVILDYAENYGY